LFTPVKEERRFSEKHLLLLQKLTVNVHIDFIYRRVELETKLLNHIVQVAEETKPLVSLLLCQ